MFYSYCFIHRGEIAGNTGYRKEASSLGIDKFVLSKASVHSTNYEGDYGTGGHVEEIIGNLPRRYDDYIKNLIGKPNVILVKYEEMVTNYRNWLEKFIIPFPVNNKNEVIDKLVELSPAFFPERKQDTMTHIRHITPGDHKEKLKSSTIQQLNKIFNTTLDALNYEK